MTDILNVKVNGEWVGIPAIKGDNGQDGQDGEGVPTGGTTGQVLTKKTNTDYDTEWQTLDALPTQTGQSGKYLTTDGSSASWGSISIPTVNDATLTINQGGTLKGTFTANASSNVTVNLDGNQRNIGEIVQSTIPLTDAGLHLLDGSLLAYGSYQAFIDYIADLYDSGDYTAIFDTEANWQTAVTTYGVCGKFVYDSVNNTVRLPKITGFTEGTITPSSIGDLTQAGLPNITGEFSSGSSGIVYSSSEFSGAFIQGTSLAGQLVGQGSGGSNRVGFNASNSNSIYGNSNTVQPQSIKVLYYIVIATSTKTDIQVDIDEIATDLNGKADVDLSNAVPSSSFAGVLLTSGIGTVISSFHSGDDFYLVFAGGFCIQGGRYGAGTGNTSGSVTYLKVFAQNDYCLQGNLLQAVNGAGYDNEKPNTPTTTGFSFSYNNGRTYSWFAMGQLAEGEY